jgi:hypothetical protein
MFSELTIALDVSFKLLGHISGCPWQPPYFCELHGI